MAMTLPEPGDAPTKFTNRSKFNVINFASTHCPISMAWNIHDDAKTLVYLRALPAIWNHCHPKQVNASCLNPSQKDQYLTYLPRKDGRLS